MTVYDCIPIEQHGMSEWTLLVFVFLGIGIGFSIRVLMAWKDSHDDEMDTQTKRIDAHDIMLSDVRLDMTEIKLTGEETRHIVERMEKPLNNMAELNKMVITKVLADDKP